MKDFAHLVKTIDSTNKTNQKVEALAQYFKNASNTDKVWTIAILSHRRPPRPVNSTLIRGYASELAEIHYGFLKNPIILLEIWQKP